MSKLAPIAVLFVCLGNICRSPLAEAAFRLEAGRAGLVVKADSAGTSDWHIGRAPDPRAQVTALRHGIDISGYQARQVQQDDFDRFDMIFALDEANLDGLRNIAPAEHRAHLGLLMDMVPGRTGQAVADPYYGDDAGFEVTWGDVDAAAKALVERLGAVQGRAPA